MVIEGNRATPDLEGEDAIRFLEEMQKPPTEEKKAMLRKCKEVFQEHQRNRAEEKIDKTLNEYDIFGLFFYSNKVKYFDDFREELISNFIKKDEWFFE